MEREITKLSCATQEKFEKQRHEETQTTERDDESSGLKELDTQINIENGFQEKLSTLNEQVDGLEGQLS